MLTSHAWPRAIAHIDGDAFFASVEQALDPNLLGKPVITGAERGLVLAASYEAKARGVTRGMLLSEVTRLCPDCVLIPSHFEAYSLFSQRLFAILRRFSPAVQEYSIDEAFVDLTGTRRLHRGDYAQLGARIQEMIRRELGIGVSIGISLTKTLAKVCSKRNKPMGLTVVNRLRIHPLLAHTPIDDVCGIGPNTAKTLQSCGVRTALDFARRDEGWVEHLLGKRGLDLWRELRGEPTSAVQSETSAHQQSISRCRTFSPASGDETQLRAQVLENLEQASAKARRLGLSARRISLSLRTERFDWHGDDIVLARPTAALTELIAPALQLLRSVQQQGIRYRATSITLAQLTNSRDMQFGLFESARAALVHQHVSNAIDQISQRHGFGTVHLAESLRVPSLRRACHAPTRMRLHHHVLGSAGAKNSGNHAGGTSTA